VMGFRQLAKRETPIKPTTAKRKKRNFASGAFTEEIYSDYSMRAVILLPKW
jgi:hypothetical protein